MQQTDIIGKHWLSLLQEAAAHPHGSARGLTGAPSADVVAAHPYRIPSDLYVQLLCDAAKSSPSFSPVNVRPCAGYLTSDVGKCGPVFVAHSLFSAVWLLRSSVPQDTLPDSSWLRLTRAAASLARPGDDADEESDYASRGERDDEQLLPPLLAQRNKRKRPRVEDEEGKDKEGEDEGENEEGEGETEEATKGSRRDAPALLTTVTNRNRRALRQQGARGQVKGQRRRTSMGLVEPAEDAPVAEHAAYTLIEPREEPTVSWVLRQPTTSNGNFLSTAKQPYTTVRTMLNKANAIGSAAAVETAQLFLDVWQSRGSPVVRSRGALVVPSQSQAAEVAVDPIGFCGLWDTVTDIMVELKAQHIQYRWAMAFLYRMYDDEVKRLQVEDKEGPPSRRGRGGRGRLKTEVKNALFARMKGDVTKDAFNQRLKRAGRWFEAAETLGWGCLCLMPYEDITQSWVEQGLCAAEWTIWLGLVKRVNPKAVEVGQVIDQWLGKDCIAGGPYPPKEQLRLEMDLLATVASVEEMADSEEEEEGDEVGDE
jgi:hypothetical protein